MGSLDGKVAWVTGSGSGIGQAGAVALAGAGAHVVLTGRREQALAETKARIDAAGGSASIEPLDVTDVSAVGALVSRIESSHQRLDVFVNSAGWNAPNRHFFHLTPEAWERTIDVNLNGATYCILAVLPIMRRQQNGLIVNVSSWAGRREVYMVGPGYNSSKAAVISMTTSLNIEECVNGIRACVICPGEVATPILHKRPIAPSEEEIAKMLQPEDLGRTILFVAESPAHMCVNEIIVTPTYNRIFLGGKDIDAQIATRKVRTE